MRGGRLYKATKQSPVYKVLGTVTTKLTDGYTINEWLTGDGQQVRKDLEGVTINTLPLFLELLSYRVLPVLRGLTRS